MNNRIKELRIARKLSRKQLSSALNISYAALSKYETGERFPDIDTLVNFAKYFNVTVDSLLGVTLSNESPTAIGGRPDELLSLLESLTPDQKEIALEQIKLIKQLNLKKE